MYNSYVCALSDSALFHAPEKQNLSCVLGAINAVVFGFDKDTRSKLSITDMRVSTSIQARLSQCTATSFCCHTRTCSVELYVWNSVCCTMPLYMYVSFCSDVSSVEFRHRSYLMLLLMAHLLIDACTCQLLVQHLYFAIDVCMYSNCCLVF